MPGGRGAGCHGSLHWAHPRRNWAWPIRADCAIGVRTGGAEQSEREGGRGGEGGEGGLEGEGIVAMVEWDNGNVGEYSLQEEPFESKWVEEGKGTGRPRKAGRHMATLVLAHQKTDTSTTDGPHIRDGSQTLKGEGFKPHKFVGRGNKVRRPVAALGCNPTRFGGNPQVFVVEAVSGGGEYEWAYSAQLDGYMRTSC
jgi:hypothetical protein